MLKLTSIAKLRISFALILLLTLAAGFIDYPAFYYKSINYLEKTFLLDLQPKTTPFILMPFKLGLDLVGGVELIYEADVKNISPADRASALDGIRDVIERRVNLFGVQEPLVQTVKSADKWRVLVALAGLKDVQSAIKQIGDTPFLEFQETIESGKEFKANHLLICYKGAVRCEKDFTKEEASKKINELKLKATKDNFVALVKEHSTEPKADKSGGDLGWFTGDQMVKSFSDAVAAQSISSIVGPVETEFGFHLIYKTGEQPARQWVKTQLNGQHLKKSSVQFNSGSSNLYPEVSLEFNEEGKKLFGEITARNLEKPVAIVLDGSIISAPTVKSAISDGKAVISGEFDLESAKLLAQRLNAGALPVPIKLVSQNTIGSSLGMESLEKSLNAGVIGLLLVALFMLLYYRLPGAVAVASLLIYGIITFAVLKIFGITLTLAGITGFILSMGMAVDANILIFERLKEELQNNKHLGIAVEDSFGRAWLSIRDANICSLITAGILFWFGNSIVQGFALTLAIGIVISMFSAVLTTKVFLKLAARHGKLGWLWLSKDN